MDRPRSDRIIAVSAGWAIYTPVAFWPGLTKLNTMGGEPTLTFRNLSPNVEDFQVNVTLSLLVFPNGFKERNVVTTSNPVQIPVTSTSLLAANSYAAAMLLQLYGTSHVLLPSMLMWGALPYAPTGVVVLATPCNDSEFHSRRNY